MPLPRAIAAARDQAAQALDPILRLTKPDLRRVADVVSKGAAVLVIGPPDKGMTAIEFTSLFPPGEWLNATGVARADPAAAPRSCSARPSHRLARRSSRSLVHAEPLARSLSFRTGSTA